MRYIIIFVSLLILWTFTSCQKSNTQKEGEVFFDCISESFGSDAVNALYLATSSFDEFLLHNFPEDKSENERIYSYLKQQADGSDHILDWKFQTESNMFILDSLFSAKVVYNQMGTSSYRQGATHRSKEMNFNFDFINAISSCAPTNSFVQSDIEVRQIAGKISPAIMAQAFIDSVDNYSHPINKILLVMDYIDWMKWDIDRKKPELKEAVSEVLYREIENLVLISDSLDKGLNLFEVTFFKKDGECNLIVASTHFYDQSEMDGFSMLDSTMVVFNGAKTDCNQFMVNLDKLSTRQIDQYPEYIDFEPWGKVFRIINSDSLEMIRSGWL